MWEQNNLGAFTSTGSSGGEEANEIGQVFGDKVWAGNDGWVTQEKFDALKAEGKFRIGQQGFERGLSNIKYAATTAYQALPDPVEEVIEDTGKKAINQISNAFTVAKEAYHNLPGAVQYPLRKIKRGFVDAPLSALSDIDKGFDWVSEKTNIGRGPLDLAIEGAELAFSGGTSNVAKRVLRKVDDVTDAFNIAKRTLTPQTVANFGDGTAALTRSNLASNIGDGLVPNALAFTPETQLGTNVTKITPTETLTDLSKSEKGKNFKTLAAEYRKEHGSLKGFIESLDEPFVDSVGNLVVARPAATAKNPWAVKLAYKSDRTSAGLTRAASEWRMTPFDEQTWTKTLGDGFYNPKVLKLDQHHQHMVKGYDWGFDGLSRAEGKKLSKMLFDEGHALGRVNYNKLNLPKPVHDALHGWMDHQLGLNGLNMPSLKGMSIEQRHKHLKVYLEEIQPAIDEAVFELMSRHNAGQPLITPNVSMIDQFTDAYKYKPKALDINKQNPYFPVDHITKSVKSKIYEPRWKIGSVEYTWRPTDIKNPRKGTGQIDIPTQDTKNFYELKNEFFDQIKELPPGSTWELNPRSNDQKRINIYTRLFKNSPNIVRNSDPSLGWILTVP